jgi:hypothetical protein
MYVVCILIYVSMNPYIYLATKSTKHISGLTAGSAQEQFEVCLKMMIE